MHLNGLGTPRSCSVAVQFLKAVAERGPWGTMLEEAHQALQGADTETALHLYATLAEGGCACRGRTAAARLSHPCINAAAANVAPMRHARRRYEVAQSNVAFLLDRQYQHSPNASVLGLRGEALAARAHEMYARAAQQGNVEAELKLGDYHYYGVGVGTDKEAAVHHYRAAAEARNGQAMFNLAYMYAHGLGLSRDYHLAKRHYDMASEAVPEAYPAVKLAMMELRLMQAWDERYGGKEGVYDYLARAGPSAETLALVQQGDTLLILGLTLLLGVVLSLRLQR
jgi:SEL1 protein